MPKEGLDVPPSATQIAENVNGIVQRHIDMLLAGNISRDKFVISKSLKKKYKNQSVPQFILANKLRKRIFEGKLVAEPPTAGDRIPYVVTEGKRKSVTGWRIQIGSTRTTCIYAKSKYYLENQIRNPMRQLLAPFSECPQAHHRVT